MARLIVLLLAFIFSLGKAMPKGSNVFNLQEWGMKIDTNCQCGPIKSEDLTVRIVGGEEAKGNVYPWMAAIMVDGRMFCGGAIINDRYILTAGHCVNWQRLQKMVVVLRTNDHEDIDENNKYEVEKLINHEDFGGDHIHDTNDIALLKLKRTIQFDDQASPICLPKPDKNLTDARAIVSGWGLTKEKGKSSRTLKQATLTVLSNKECKSTSTLIKDHITPTVICAYKKNVDACQGDSGGPIFRNEGGRAEEIGVVSWGMGCAQPGMPGVYTRVDNYLEWIAAHTQDATYCVDPLWK